MAGITDLQVLLSSMEPILKPNYCCPLKLKMAKTSNPKPCKFGLRAYSFKK